MNLYTYIYIHKLQTICAMAYKGFFNLFDWVGEKVICLLNDILSYMYNNDYMLDHKVYLKSHTYTKCTF